MKARLVRVGLMLAAAIAFLLTSTPQPALAFNCTAIASGNWNSSGTWTGCGTGSNAYPGNNDVVFIPSPYTVTLTTNASARQVTIDAGATLDVQAASLTLTNGGGTGGAGVTVNGTIIFGATGALLGSGSAVNAHGFWLAAGGTLITANADGITSGPSTLGSVRVAGRTYSHGANYEYNGTATQNTGDGLTAANNLTVNNPAGVRLTQSIVVSGALSLTSGNLITGENVLTQAGGCTSLDTGDVVGTVRRTGLAAGQAYCFGNYSNVLTLDRSGSAPSQLDVVLALSAPADFPNAVSRYYIINPADGSSYAGTLHLRHLPSELNGNTPEANLAYWRYEGTKWIPTQRPVSTPLPFVSLGGAKGFSRWAFAVSGPSAPTPVIISNFSAEANSWNPFAVPCALGGMGIVVLGSLLVVLTRRS